MTTSFVLCNVATTSCLIWLLKIRLLRMVANMFFFLYAWYHLVHYIVLFGMIDVWLSSNVSRKAEDAYPSDKPDILLPFLIYGRPADCSLLLCALKCYFGYFVLFVVSFFSPSSLVSCLFDYRS